MSMTAFRYSIVKNPEIFIFDDSFSALDYKTDAMLRKAMESEPDKAEQIRLAAEISRKLLGGWEVKLP